jgi:flagellar L-ring protein precursor FlgH
MKHLAATAALMLLAGCTAHDNIVTGPRLSPVGEGLVSERHPLPVSFADPGRSSFHSLWAENTQDLYRDLRARDVGDVVTVTIAIDDKAEFENESDRSREGNTRFGFGAALGFGGFGGEAKAGEASGNLDINSGTASRGRGSIDRAEKLRLSIAAVVTEELPNGNLIIRGSQEVKVNNEVRVLHIAGIVRPLDISNDNVIAYDKIAEARISYGGRGRLTDVQQPAWGQRLYDSTVPF